MRVICIVLLLMLMVVPSVYGISLPSTELKILDIRPMPEVAYTGLSLDLEFKVENTGYEKVLIMFDSDFGVHTDNIDGALGEAIITNRIALRDKYGDPEDPTSFRNTHFVMTSTTPISRGGSLAYSDPGGTEVWRSWYIRPNERLIGHIKLAPNSVPHSGTLDPFVWEEDLPSIEVMEFNAIIRFEPSLNSYGGFISAPYIVKGATLVTSYPNIFADGNDFDETEYYWETFKLPETEETRIIDVVDWDDWFSFSSLPFAPSLLASADLEYYPIEEVEKSSKDEEVFVPVWLAQPGIDFISYEYQWRKNFPVTGVNLDYLKKPPRVAVQIPEWNGWF